jgi:hypothetical protein
MEDNQRVRIGTLYMPFGYATVLDQFFARATDRQAFSDGERERLTPELRTALLEALQAILGPDVKDLKLTYSMRAGCSCPCSPGFCVSGVIVRRDWNNRLLEGALQQSSGRDKAVFYLRDDGTLEARGSEVTWRSGPRGRGKRAYNHPPIMSYLVFGKRVAPPVKVTATPA